MTLVTLNKMRLKDINRKNIRSFVVGNLNYTFNLLDTYEKQQVALRATLCEECTINGRCISCTCKTPNMYHDQSKECEEKRWYKMMDEQEWNEFISKFNYKPPSHLDGDEQAELILQELAKQYSMEQKAKFEDFVTDPSQENTVINQQVSDPEMEQKENKITEEEAIKQLHVLTNVPYVYDFGNIPQMQPVSYEFIIKNTLNFPISVKSVKPSCQCTAATAQINTDIDLGEEFKITLSYDAKNLGKFTKSAQVNFNNPNINPVLLILKGNVVQTQSND